MSEPIKINLILKETCHKIGCDDYLFNMQGRCTTKYCPLKEEMEKKEATLGDFIDFIRIQYKNLKDDREICKKEDCCKIEEMLCHILYFEDSGGEKEPKIVRSPHKCQHDGKWKSEVHICVYCGGKLKYSHKFVSDDEDLVYQFKCLKCGKTSQTMYKDSFLGEERLPDATGYSKPPEPIFTNEMNKEFKKAWKGTEPREDFKSPFKIMCPDEVAKNLLISEFVKDLNNIASKELNLGYNIIGALNKTIKKWEKKLK